MACLSARLESRFLCLWDGDRPVQHGIPLNKIPIINGGHHALEQSRSPDI